MFREGDLLCYSMDLMKGGSLASLMHQPLPCAAAVGLILDILEGLDHLHARGILHRDTSASKCDENSMSS